MTHYRIHRLLPVLLTLVVLVLPAAGGTALSQTVTYRVPRVDAPITVDGKLDEPFWKEAVKVDANVEVQPAENVPAPVTTEARIAYTATHLYVAIIANDPNPSEIRAHITDRDKIFDDDWVLFLIDTFNDQRRSYDFFCNPYGIQADEIEASNGGGDWDAIWDSKGRITDEGFVVEMSIPFTSFSFQKSLEDQTWSFDIVRSYPRSVRHHIGAFPRDRSNNCYLCQAPKLIGFAGIEPGRNMEITPTFSAGVTQERDTRDNGSYGRLRQTDRKIDPGISARWNVTPNITLNAAINPDFSQVETDAAQMNINTRFPLYFSEKRPFFLEGRDFYSVGDMVHTRTLAEPEWGVKMTGKSGKNTVGFFTVRDAVTPITFSAADGANNTTLSLQSQGTVFRYRRDLFSSSNMGILVNDREGTNYYNRTAALDGVFKFTKTDSFNYLLSTSSTRYPGETADDFDQKTGAFTGSGYEVEYSHNTEDYNVYGEMSEISPGFRNDLGTINRVGFRYNEIGGQYRWRADGGHWYTFLSIYASHDWRRFWDYKPQHKVWSGRLNYEGPMQSSWGMYGEYGDNWYEGRRYRGNYIDTWGGLRPTANNNVYLSIHAGDQIDYTNDRPGTVFSISPEYSHRIGDHLNLSLGHRYETLTIDPGRLYTGNVSNLNARYQFTERLFFRAILQYVAYDRKVEHYDANEQDDVDAESRSVVSQFLLSYKINPQTVFFLGYSDNYQNENRDDLLDQRNSDTLFQTNRAVFTKIGYAWQL